MKRSPIARVSAGKLAALSAAGQPRPWSTLNRTTTLARNGALARAARDRKPLVRPVNTGPTAATVAVVVERDQGQCVRCGLMLRGMRGLDWSVQHRRARGDGGTRRPDTNQAHNLILLCGSATTGCHGWVESYREAAREHGWAIRQTDDPAAEPVRHSVHGLVWLTADGSFTRRRPAAA